MRSMFLNERSGAEARVGDMAKRLGGRGGIRIINQAPITAVCRLTTRTTCPYDAVLFRNRGGSGVDGAGDGAAGCQVLQKWFQAKAFRLFNDFSTNFMVSTGKVKKARAMDAHRVRASAPPIRPLTGPAHRHRPNEASTTS